MMLSKHTELLPKLQWLDYSLLSASNTFFTSLRDWCVLATSRSCTEPEFMSACRSGGVQTAHDLLSELQE